MSVQWSKTKTIEIQGLNYVQRVVNDAGSIFHNVDGTNDIGIDGYIEFVENGSPTGLFIGVQVKAGNSNQSGKNNTISIKTDRKHFQYWYNHILPVIAVVYIPIQEKGYWVDVTQYLADNEDIIEDGPFTVNIPIENIFDLEGFSLFHHQLRRYLSSYGDEKYFGRSLKLLVDSKIKENRYKAIKSLFSFHRNKPETWYYLITRFCFEEDTKVQIALIYAYKHLLTHGDIWWHPGNIIEEGIIKETKQYLSRYFGINEVSKLLNHIDEGGISRGTVGYDVNLILRLIPERVEFLKKIILIEDTQSEKRYWAAVCLINEFQYYDLVRAINFADSMIQNFPTTENIESFTSIKEMLKEFSGFEFTN